MYRKIILIVLLFGAVFANSNQKVILITGTAHGIGKSTAQYLLDKGHIVYGGDILIEENLYLNEIGGVALEMDVTKQDHVDSAINQIPFSNGSYILIHRRIIGFDNILPCSVRYSNNSGILIQV